MVAEQTLESPRIALLQQALISGNVTALETFWQEVSEQSAPLIEAIEGDDKHYLMTFLWRARTETHNAVVWGGPAGLDDPEGNQMTRLLETDLWYRTYRVQAALRGVYSLSENDPLTDAGDSSIDFTVRFQPDPLNPHQFVHHKDEEISDAKEVVFSIFELPDAPAQSWIIPQP
ncbi:MAG TPA: enterochelin esterase domain-containing protein, partial [Ktedonobacteraceae bacterium]|nr:enterochelin esterase domain-containing protein [Ktedonobacteraceae bacterium]